MIPSPQLQTWFATLSEDTQDLDTWLIFSDWLEEQDHPQAEITRLWATHRWNPEHWTPAQEQRLQALLDDGLRPCLPCKVNSVGMQLGFVPKGTFWMGWKHRQKQVNIEHNFYIGIYPVTQGQWEDLMGYNPSWFSHKGGGQAEVNDVAETDLRDFPVERVSWEDARAFLTYLNTREEGDGKWTYQLPTEAMWEYACREAASSKEACSFPYYLANRSETLSPELANFDFSRPVNTHWGKSLMRTTKVGAYPPNRLNLYDMHGNVWEWTNEWIQEPAWHGKCRIISGGSWLSSRRHCTAVATNQKQPDYRDNNLGFRLVLIPSSAK